MQARDPISFYLKHRVNLPEIGQSLWNRCVLFAKLSHNLPLCPAILLTWGLSM